MMASGFNILPLAFIVLMRWCLQPSYSLQCSHSSVSGTVTATTNLQEIQVPAYRNNQDCTLRIDSYPTSPYFFLQIYWLKFDIDGNMPFCSDYVEVLITSSYRSLGRFCSSNGVVKPFTMYSHDGNAKIKFHSDGSGTGSGFKLKYRLLPTRTSYLSLGCGGKSYIKHDPKYGSLSSSHWPVSYQGNIDWCEHRIQPSRGKETKIVFMDVNVKTNNDHKCTDEDDFLEVKGSNSPSDGYYQMTTVKSKFCSGTAVSVTTKFRYITVFFERHFGSNSKRGFVAGYVTYGKIYKASQRPSTIFNPGLFAGVTFAVLVGLCGIYSRNRWIKRRNVNCPTREHVTTPAVIPNLSVEDHNMESTLSFPVSTELMNVPPPSYSDAISTPYDPPPSYTEYTQNMSQLNDPPS